MNIENSLVYGKKPKTVTKTVSNVIGKTKVELLSWIKLGQVMMMKWKVPSPLLINPKMF